MRVIVSRVGLAEDGPFQIEAKRPGPRIYRWIVVDGFESCIIGVYKFDPRGDMHLVAREITGAAETAFGIVIRYIDHESISLPVPARIAHPQLEIGTSVRASIQGNDLVDVATFVFKKDVPVVLQDLNVV